MKRPEYIDIHSHINFADYDTDREDVIARALDAGVWMINVGVDAKSSAEVVNLAQGREGVYAIVGLHPLYAEEDFDIGVYRALAQHPKVVAIGECGLDFSSIEAGSDEELYASVSYKQQEKVFRLQIELAIEFKKPLMIHARNSYKRILEILDEYLNRDGVVLTGNAHFFAGSVEEAQAFLDRGFTVSFTGVITFASPYKALVQYVPLDKMMSETDSPYVAPIPYRGRRSEPLYVAEVVKKIAEFKELPLEDVKKALVNNAFLRFGLE